VRDLGVLGHRVVAHDAHAAAVGVQQSAQQADRRRLAGAVGPNQPEHLPRLDVERHAVNRGDRAVALCRAVQ
jgi:hypothetical protein